MYIWAKCSETFACKWYRCLPYNLTLQTESVKSLNEVKQYAGLNDVNKRHFMNKKMRTAEITGNNTIERLFVVLKILFEHLDKAAQPSLCYRSALRSHMCGFGKSRKASVCGFPTRWGSSEHKRAVSVSVYGPANRAHRQSQSTYCWIMLGYSLSI